MSSQKQTKASSQGKKSSQSRKSSQPRKRVVNSTTSSTKKKTTPISTVQAIVSALRSYALSLPEAYEEFPWGERVVKVNKKVFVFLGRDDAISFSVKLPISAEIALSFAFASPTGYGLGKSGWVSITPASDETLPFEMMTAWIEESYRSIAPKKLVAKLDRSR